MARHLDAALIAAAEAAADVAGAAIRPLFRAGLTADLKSDASPVTIADRTAEQAMRAVLRERFPEHGILGEEFGLERPEARWRWVLDPIDGTRAFITGRAQFCVLVALMEDGVPVLGVIDQPVTRERWVGAAGRPTRFRGLAGEAGCRACPMLGAAELSCTNPDMYSPEEKAAWERLRARVRRVSYGGDSFTYGLLALGQIDVIAEPDLKIWDWAALLPVIEGAGGSLTDWRGERLRAPGDEIGAVQRVLALGDPSLRTEAVGLLTG